MKSHQWQNNKRGQNCSAVRILKFKCPDQEFDENGGRFQLEGTKRVVLEASQAAFEGKDYRLRAVGNAEFAENVIDVEFDGAFGNE